MGPPKLCHCHLTPTSQPAQLSCGHLYTRPQLPTVIIHTKLYVLLTLVPRYRQRNIGILDFNSSSNVTNRPISRIFSSTPFTYSSSLQRRYIITAVTYTPHNTTLVADKSHPAHQFRYRRYSIPFHLVDCPSLVGHYQPLAARLRRP